MVDSILHQPSQIRAIETRYKGYRFRSNDLPKEGRKPATKRADRTGMRFGRLFVETDLGPTKNGYRWWGCVCSCGEKVAVRSRELDRGHTRSCGCLHKEVLSKRPGSNRLPAGRASRNELLASYKKSASSRGHEWRIPDENFDALVTGECVYCGASRTLFRKPNKQVNGGFYYTGIDRVDNNKGYVLGNVVSCCWDCNRAKGKLSADDFQSWINRLAARSARFEHGARG